MPTTPHPSSPISVQQEGQDPAEIWRALARAVDQHPDVSSDRFDQPQRFAVAKKVADGFGVPVVTLLLFVQGYADAWACLPPRSRTEQSYMDGYRTPLPEGTVCNVPVEMLPVELREVIA